MGATGYFAKSKPQQLSSHIHIIPHPRCHLGQRPTSPKWTADQNSSEALLSASPQNGLSPRLELFRTFGPLGPGFIWEDLRQGGATLIHMRQRKELCMYEYKERKPR